MAKQRHSVEQIVRKLREAEVELAKRGRVKEVCRTRRQGLAVALWHPL